MPCQRPYLGEILVAEVSVGLYLEDLAQEKLVTTLVRRISESVGVEVRVDVMCSTGGIPRMRRELRRYLDQCANFGIAPFALLIIVEDTDCRGQSLVRRELNEVVERTGYIGKTIIASPAPHIECWYLADPVALQRITQSPQLSAIPSADCEKDLYKRQLAEQFSGSLMDGIEYAEDIASEMDVFQASRNVSSLGGFLQELRSALTMLGDAS